MILFLLGLITEGYNKYNLYQRETISVKANTAIYPSDLENLTYQDTSNKNLTWPYWSPRETEIVITPIFPPDSDIDYRKVEIIGATIPEECYAVEGVFNDYLRTNPYPGYYSEPICYAFFNSKFGYKTICLFGSEKRQHNHAIHY
ncbi:hypothetical protein TVAG_050200 [Trichomonas vaginalis G3]|uniref:Uncharacterized protein n=1 Tax=Trichomonas vaginalis (strain ATCC PRA-98 / G3) TaxID=412133 RepID=A2EJE8_TRIV3|nr:hypothetical protein TVAGG3_0389550 [Trichomonas vaginalis G3]EAY07205.1 hypothetical protein TVAG_050200 [Trichomonas vaginalis G3]KAI5533893.1 hypothetical protein TVAGG3_0389550 [Trichomonas vaginalis G3]|eukprot:XP_001319428.1 hypothetical protein [Trichomonas vaginalis G3]